MVMTEAEAVMINLMRAALFGVPVQNDHPNVDWDVVQENAEQQTVDGLIAKQVPQEAGKAWQQTAVYHLAHIATYLVAQQDLVNAFEQAGIPMAIMKGAAVARYYPAPEDRSMGDIDFIVPQDRFQEACELMRACDYSGKWEEIYENQELPRHVSFYKGIFTFELHHHFSYSDLNIESFITEGLKHKEYGEIYSYRFPILPRLANGLVLLAHMRDHLKSGLGLRQVIDWMMFVNSELDNEFWENEFRDAAESVQMDILAITVTRMCQLYFGLSECYTWCSGADVELCHRLLELLLVSGNFGRKHGSGSSIEAVSMAFQNNGFFRQLQLSGEQNWKAYHRNPKLKPLCWGYQLGRYINRGMHTGRDVKFFEDLSRSKERYVVLKKLRITN